ncbi:MAG TPA: VOC family protein [Acidimicrobiales bacterium]
MPVTDQERAKTLFVGLGFTETMDVELQPGFRWIEMAPADSGATISIVQAGPEAPVGIDTGIRLETPDAAAAHARVSSQGLDVGELLDWDSVPLMFSFLDPDGNRFYVSETS